MEFTDKPLEPFGETLLDVTVPTQLSFKTPLVFRMVKQLKAHKCLPWTGSHRAELTFDEAITNAMLHGNKLMPERKVRVLLCADAERWGAIIEDQGDGFGPEQLPDPDAPDAFLKEQGRGILLMDGYLETLAYNRGSKRLLMTHARQAEPDAQEALAAVLGEEKAPDVPDGVSVSEREGIQVAVLGSSRVVDDNVDDIRRALLAAADKNRLLAVDLSHVEFISSVGLGMLVTLFKHIRSRGGELMLAGLQAPVKDILDSAHLLKLFHVAPDSPSAVIELKKLA